MENIETLLKSLTLEEKAALVAGTDFMHTNPVPRLKIPSLCMADGPHGLRKQAGEQDNGISQSEPSTAFPTAAALACGFNADNARRAGEAIAEECRHYGVNVLLGPGMNIKRNPLCGRNFEYFSEDPHLTGVLAAAEVEGIQSRGVSACVKHFAVNNSENYRFMGNSIADERAVRDVYLKAFEYVVKRAKPHALMCAYNRVNGVFCSENKWLLTDILREEWGYEGTVMTDWGAIRDRVEAVKARLSLEMPGDTLICRKRIVNAVKNGELEIALLDGCVRDILRLIEKSTYNAAPFTADFKAHHALAAEIAADCAVLMKNDGVLPLKKGEKYCIVGDLFQKMRYQGAGSSMINPAYLTTPKNSFDEHEIDYVYARGYAENTEKTDEKLIEEAVALSKNFKSVLVFAGLTDLTESEGRDRDNLSLPQNQLDLISALLNAGKKIIIVLFGGSVVELPFADESSAILNMLLGGQNCGTAVYRLLFGEVSPGGRLAESWVKSYEDVPFGKEFSKCQNEVYKESVFVGYRYYATVQKEVAFPFGFGLSYTTFGYENLTVARAGDKITAEVTVTNTGGYDGAEVVQLYVRPPERGVFKPAKELRAFTKIFLKAGESKRVTLGFEISDLKYYNVKLRRRVLEGGEYTVEICKDCITPVLAHSIELESDGAEIPYETKINAAYRRGNLQNITDEIFEELSGLKIPPLPPKKPITLESPFIDLKQTFFGKILYSAVLGMSKKQLKKAKKLPEGAERDNRIKGAVFLENILNSNCLRSMSMTTTRLPFNFAEGMVLLSNGHILGAIKKFCTKIKAPKLPKEEK